LRKPDVLILTTEGALRATMLLMSGNWAPGVVDAGPVVMIWAGGVGAGLLLACPSE